MRNVYSVSQVNRYIKSMFAEDYILHSIYVRGEVSNCKYHSSGHIYFTLKDASGAISCVLFAGRRRGLSFRMKEGDQVIAAGTVDVYERDGRYQLYADRIVLDGVGLLNARYEELKRRLEETGMFDEIYKKPIPGYIQTLGVVTAPTGAAIRDIINISTRRNPYIQIILYPAVVQGDGAAASICEGIRKLDRYGVDVIIIGRGGGSLEDLWAFNEEIVVRAIAACPVPVVSAVGHEVDVTLSDLAADVRAATPSVAAEVCVPEREALLATIQKMRGAMARAAKNGLLARQSRLALCEKRLAARHPAALMRDAQAKADLLGHRLQALMERQFTILKNKTNQLTEQLNALGPRQALNRGYAILLDGKQAVTSAEQAPENMTVLLQDGRLDVRVLEKRKGDPFGEEASLV